MDSLLNSILSEFFDTDNHHLVIGNQKFSDIIKEAPNRPSFIYTKHVIEKKSVLKWIYLVLFWSWLH